MTNTAADDPTELVIYRISCSTPHRFSFENSYGVVKYDEVLQIPVVLNSFPSLLASEDVSISEFTVDYTRCEDEYFDYEPKEYWDRHIGDSFIRKTTACKAIGYEDRDRVDGKLQKADPTEAMVEYDGLSHFNNEPQADVFLGETSDIDKNNDNNDLAVSVTGPFDSPSVSVFPKCLFFLGENYS